MGKLRLLALLGTLLISGCAGLHHPDPPLADDPARVMPVPVKNRVHVLFVHGPGAFLGGDLADLRRYAIELGFIKTYSASSFQVKELANLALEERAHEPQTRYVVVAHGAGCAALTPLATRLGAIDAVLAIAPGKAALPAASRVVAIIPEGEDAPEAHQTHILDVKPSKLPEHPQARAILAHELALSAQQVRVMEEKRGPVIHGGNGPWDFLGCKSHPCPRCLPLGAAREAVP